MLRMLIALSLVLSGLAGAAPCVADDRVARVGVLAYRGTDKVALNWIGLIQYLDGSVEGWRFEIVPVTLASADGQIGNGELDFLVTNPGHYVDLESRHAMSVIASRRQLKSDGSFASEFGSAIIARAGSGISHLGDARGRVVAAVDRNAFGGFQIAWREFENAGIDLFTDAASLSFVGFPMDQVVRQVMDGQADIGIVRGGLVEQLVDEGTLERGALVVLNAGADYTHPDKISTRLYPEWPFAAFATTPPELRDKVALALLQSSESRFATETGMRDVWSAPVSYRAAADLIEAYTARGAQASPVKAPLPGTSWPAVALWALAGLILGLAAFGVAAFRRRQPPGATGADPADEHDESQMTPREREILDLISKGHSTKEIARLLGISPKTVEYHRANLLRKFGARTSSQLVAMAT
jgi:two-component system sensor histidine kinase TtrS